MVLNEEERQHKLKVVAKKKRTYHHALKHSLHICKQRTNKNQVSMQASRHQIMSIAQTIQRALSNVGDVDQQREVLRRALDHKVFAEVRPISWNTWKDLKSSNDIFQNVKVGL